jgi:predicted Rossmann fold nucleotide-binding protein DprA/Smf involved in DNA uptake
MATDPNIARLTPDSPRYPEGLRRFLAERAPSAIFARGNLEILDTPTLALFSSVRCPGNLILQTYDIARALRGLCVTVIGGFHTPMEKECLRLLLRGKSPVIICPARSIDRYRIPPDWRQPLADGRLLLLSSFTVGQRRPTADLAIARNELVAAIADEILVTFAAGCGKTEALALQVLACGKPVFILSAPENVTLAGNGAIAIDLRSLPWKPGTTKATLSDTAEPDAGRRCLE